MQELSEKHKGTEQTMFDNWRGFHSPQLDAQWKTTLTDMARQCRGNIVKMTSLAASGHPGGSMSSLEVYLTLYNMANVSPKDPWNDERDRIIISHGHTSPGAYSALAAAGYFDTETAVAGFRQAGSPFEGHVEQSVPGIEWDTGNLGQGLAVGIGKAIYSRISGKNFHTYVFMGDGEQQKGQISESRRIAIKFGLKSLTAIIDYNKLQISGSIEKIMPQNIAAEWEADGWNVITIDGHNLGQIYQALHTATHVSDKPVVIIAATVMGKGVSFMENKAGYHGAPVKPDDFAKALAEIGVENNLEDLKARRAEGPPPAFSRPEKVRSKIVPGRAVTYDASTDNRSAFGSALLSFAEANMARDDFTMAVFDCDLAGSVKTAEFEKKYSDNFFQFGISEHSTATAAGALSTENAISVWADFGVFGIAETYNQARLSDINHANMKLFCTHCGVDVGEDGKTHQSIDYFALLNSTFGWKLITPADPNQTDRAVRYALSQTGNFAIIMGRSKLPIITDENGHPFFGGEYEYRYGRMEEIRKGNKVALVCAGNMLSHGLKAWELLKSQSTALALYSISDWSDLHADDIRSLASYEHLVTLEDHNVKTGLGTALASAIMEQNLSTHLVKLGVTKYASSGKPAELYKLLGLDPESVAKVIGSLS